MAVFRPVRHTGQSSIPIEDGQFLVDYNTGTISIDKGASRTLSRYVYGIVKTIGVNTWIPKDGLYYIDITALAKDDLPDGHTVVGASMISGAVEASTDISNNSVKITSYDRVDGSVLIFALAGTGDIQDSDPSGLIALYHMEESDEMVNSVDGTTSPKTNWVSYSSAKYGTHAMFKSSLGYLDVPCTNTINSFTIEWWQYDMSQDGDGGVILADKNGRYVTIPSVAHDSSMYKHKEWRHYAVSHRYDGPVSVYLNGTLVGYTEVDTPLEGPFKFYGTQKEDGSIKSCIIDELAIFNYARYTESFDVPTCPYISNTEVQIGVYSDISISGVTGDSVIVEIPVSIPDGTTLEYDIEDLSQALSDISIDGNTLTGTIKTNGHVSCDIIAKYPGSISRRITVNLNEAYITGYYGYFTSESILSVKGITSSELTQSSMHEITGNGYITINAPAGSFTVIVVPASSDLKAYKKTLVDTYSTFYENTGISGSGSNGAEVTIDGINYRIYGEFNLIDTTSIVNISGTTKLPVQGNYDAGYVGDDLYLPIESGDSVQYIQNTSIQVTDDNGTQTYTLTSTEGGVREWSN